MKRFAGLVLLAILTVPGVLSAQSAPGVQGPPENLGHKAAREEGHGAENIALWKMANFVLLAGALGWFFWKKGGPFYRARTEEIQRGIAQATKLREEAEARYREMVRRLASLGAEIESLRKAAREESAVEGERVRDETHRELEKVRVQAETEIAAAAKAARAGLRAFSAELAVSLAERRIRERITPDADNGLIAAAVQQLGTAPHANAVEAS